MNYEEAKEYLFNIPRFSKKTTMENTKYILKKMGEPDEKFKIFHVAGSNGKGSVCAYISNILREAGFRVGLFTSPHLVRPNERIKTDGIEATDEEFLWAFLQVKRIVDEDENVVHPSFFEYIFLMAMAIFAKKNVEYVVLEVGLGGRLDATNAVGKKLVSVITSLSLEHTEILGDTIESIAKEKAGIIKKGVPVVVDGTNKEALKVVEELAYKKESEVVTVKSENIKILKKADKNIDFSLNSSYHNNVNIRVPFIALYQCMNASVAVEAIEMAKRYDKTLEIVDYEKIYKGISLVKWEGRMECINENIYVDGAHNVSGISRFIEAAKDICNVGEKYLLFSVVKEKDYNQMIKMLCESVAWKHVYIVGIDTERATDTEEIKLLFEECGQKNVSVYKGVNEGFEEATGKMGSDDVLFCAGSLYLVGEIKSYLEREKND